MTNTTQQKHTPGPFHIQDRPYQQVRISPAHIAKDDFSCLVLGRHRENNAQFIVTACNSHYELLEALKNALPLLRIGNANNIYSQAANKIEQAIARAEGRG